MVNSFREQRFSGYFPINFGQFAIESFSSVGNSPIPSTCHCFHSGISSNSSFSRELKGFLEDQLP
uniref:Putative ovule protein n=1 Tax=Solanum chacoense TaxID=4108 RepID=A0A0V0GPK1_SOLCH